MDYNSSINKNFYDLWKNINKTLFFLIFFLFLLGLFFSLVSTSLIASDKLDTNTYYFFYRHLFYITIAFSILIVFSSIETKNLIIISYFLFFLSIIFLILVPLIGVEVKGSKRWIDLIFLPRFQPIEIVKPFFIVLASIILSSEKNKNIYFKFFLSFLLLFPIILLLINQPDIGQTLLIFLTWFSLIFISGVNLVVFSISFSFLIISLILLVFLLPSKFGYILIRLKAFFNPKSGNSYQSDKCSDAIMNGGFFGKGIGEGDLKNRCPEAHTDYIVSVISEEFGILFIIFLMIILLLFAHQVFQRINLEQNNLYKLILMGSVCILIFQSLIHIGVNIRLFPTTGMTLPFISYGGSSIVGTSILAGFILNLTRRKI
mgnify:CR=1 FL=1|tara:strand:- start:181 stop:1302 length:1122 start_codon:yes stop_codon:yes gene_type:complete